MVHKNSISKNTNKYIIKGKVGVCMFSDSYWITDKYLCTNTHYYKLLASTIYKYYLCLIAELWFIVNQI